MLPAGPVLYVATLNRDDIVLRPVAEIRGDSLRSIGAIADAPELSARFAAREYRPATEFVLFARGARVGTAVVRETVEPEPPLCPRLPGARAVAELTSAARGIDRLLALRKDAVEPRLHGEVPDLALDGSMRAAGWDIASRELETRGALQPRDWLRARADIAALPPAGAASRAFAVTYLYRDQLAAEPPPEEGYALFFIAEDLDGGFEPTYVWFHTYTDENKAAPRTYDALDWDNDDSAEILLEVFGAERQWFAALDHGPAGWSLSYQDPCAPRPGNGRRAPATPAEPGRPQPGPGTALGTAAGRTPPPASAAGSRPAPATLPAVRTDLAVPRIRASRDTIP